MEDPSFPETLLEATRYFEDPQKCIDFLIPMRWPDGITCFHCKSREKHCYIRTRHVWMCKSCRKQFSLKRGTIFEGSQMGLDKWLVAMWLIVNAKNGISSCEIERSLGVTQKTAWFMLQRIRYALHAGTFEKRMQGIVEADETYIGGKARNMHASKKSKKLKGRGTSGKVIVMGLLERRGEVRAMIVKDIQTQTLQDQVRMHVEPGAELHTDSLASYVGLDKDYVHGVVNHAEAYVVDHVHNNGVENFWSLLKRSIKGTYVSVEPFHLFRYLDEQTFRFNNRKTNDQTRFLTAARMIGDKRLPYSSLIGETEEPRRGRKKPKSEENDNEEPQR